MIGSKKKNEKKETRFEMKAFDAVGRLTSVAKCFVIIDKVTGVNYLVVQTLGLGDSSNGISITPLLDKDGKPIVESN